MAIITLGVDCKTTKCWSLMEKRNKMNWWASCFFNSPGFLKEAMIELRKKKYKKKLLIEGTLAQWYILTNTIIHRSKAQKFDNWGDWPETLSGQRIHTSVNTKKQLVTDNMVTLDVEEMVGYASFLLVHLSSKWSPMSSPFTNDSTDARMMNWRRAEHLARKPLQTLNVHFSGVRQCWGNWLDYEWMIHFCWS